MEDGPCCHSDYRNFDHLRMGDNFDCYFTFNTNYCNKVDDPIEDDDFRGFGEGPEEDPDFDHINQICCELEVPTDIAGFTIIWLSMGCALAATLVWCLLFRAKNGVWSRFCPFDSPPPESHIYDAQ